MSNCIIEFNEEGIASVSTPKGNPSILYKDALNLLGEQDKALEVVSVAYTNTYKELFPDRTTEPSLSEALATFNHIRAGEISITKDDLINVSDIMFETGLESIEGLETLLTETFRPEGITTINEYRLRDSGLYSETEIINFMNEDFDLEGLNKTIDIVSRLSQEEFSTPNLELDNFYQVITTEKDGLGRHKKISDSTVDGMIVEVTKGYTSENDFYVKIQDLDIPSLVQDFNENKALAKTIYDRIDSFKAVDVVEIVEGELTKKHNNSTVSTINSTILLGKDSQEFRTLVDALATVDEDILESEPEALKENLERLEKLATRFNIDIIGVKDLPLSEAVKLLNATSNLANKASQKRVTTNDITAFAEARDNLLDNDRGFEQSLENIGSEYTSLNTLKLYSELSEEKLFNNYGLIRIGENLYHRVSTENTVSELYEELYKRYLADSNFIPAGFVSVKDKLDPKTKTTILEGLKSFINTRQTGLTIEAVESNEIASIYQVLFNHKPLVAETTDSFAAIAGASNSSEYLTKQFVADFYSLYLTEKQADSKIYKEVLSKFIFNNRDITIKDVDNRFLNILNSLTTDIPAYTQIREYAALKKNDPITSLAVINTPIGILPNIDRIHVTNNPHVLPTYQGSITRVNDYIYTKAKDSFIKVKNDIYQRVGNNVYTKVVTKKSTNYHTISTLNYKQEEVRAIEEIHNTPISTPAKTYKEFTEVVSNKTLRPEVSNFISEMGATPHPTKANTFIVRGEQQVTESIEEVKVEDSKSTNTSFEKGSMRNFSVDGGVLEIGKVNNADLSSVLRLSVEENSRRQGKAEVLLKRALNETKGELSGQASNDASVSLNYKLGLRVGGIEGLSLEESLAKRTEEVGEDGSINMSLPESKRGENYKSFKEDVKTKQDEQTRSTDGTVLDKKESQQSAETQKGEQQVTEGVVAKAEFSVDSDTININSIDTGVAGVFMDGLDANGLVNNIATESQEVLNTINKTIGEKNRKSGLSLSQKLDLIQPAERFVQFRESMIDLSNPIMEVSKTNEDITVSLVTEIDGLPYVVGTVRALNKGDHFMIETASSRLQGKGVGAEIYKELIKNIELPLIEDIRSTQAAKGVWSKLEIAGTTTTNNTGARVINPKEIVMFQTSEELVATSTPTEIFEALSSKLVGNISDIIITDKVRARKRLGELKDIGKVKQNVNFDNLSGFRDGGIVFVMNQDVNTLIHEHGHIWYSWAKQNRPDLIQKGNALIKDTVYYDRLESSSIYSEMTEAEKLEEALIQAVGDKGASFVNNQKQKDFKSWLAGLWADITLFFGISELTSKEVQNLSVADFVEAVAIDILKNRKVDWKTNPYTIQPLLDDMLANKKGKMVNVQTIRQIINQKDTKQIDKQIIEEVLELPKYKGENKIFFDEFEADLKDMLMPLEVVMSNSYADYGNSNVGVDADTSETHIYNTELDHGIRGHFNADFPATEYLGDIEVTSKYKVEKVPYNDIVLYNLFEISQDGAEKQVLREGSIHDIGRRAGDFIRKKALELPVGETMDYQMYGYGGLSNSPIRGARNVNEASDILSKEVKLRKDLENVVDLEIRPLNGQFAVVKAGVQLTQENVDDNVYTVTSSRDKAEQFIKEIANKKAINRGMFGHTRVWYDANDAYLAEIQSDSYQKAKANQMLMDSYEKDPSKMPKAQKEAYKKLKEARTAIQKGVEDKSISRLYKELNNYFKTKAESTTRLKDLNKKLSATEDIAERRQIQDAIEGATYTLDKADFNIKTYSQLLKNDPIKPLLSQDFTKANELREELVNVFTELVSDYSSNGRPLVDIRADLIKLNERKDKTRNIVAYDEVVEKLDIVARELVIGEISVALTGFSGDVNKAGNYKMYVDKILVTLAFDGTELKENLKRITNAIRLETSLQGKHRSENITKVYGVPYGQIREQISYENKLEYVLTQVLHPSQETEVVNYVGKTLQDVLDHIEKVARPGYQPNLQEYTDYFNGLKNETKLEQKVTDLASTKDKQFLAHRKNYTERLLREEIRRSADLGLETLSIPTPRTLAKIEGYLGEDGDVMPYEIITSTGFDAYELEVGDEIYYLDSYYIVIHSDSTEIDVVREEDIYMIEDREAYENEVVKYRVEEDSYELVDKLTTNKIKVGDLITEEDWEALDVPYSIKGEIGDILEEVEEGMYRIDDFEKHMEAYYRSDFDIKDHLEQIGYDVFEAENGNIYYKNYDTYAEAFQQPTEYRTDEEFDEDDLPSEQQTVINKYKKLIEFFKKEREDATIVKDEKGNEWLQTTLERTDAVEPVVAFQEKAQTDEQTINKVKEVFTTLQNPITIVPLSNEIEVNECRG